MRFVVADYESFYHRTDFSVTKLGTEAYIRDKRFEAHGCAIKWSPDLPAKWWNRHELPALFQQVDWSDVFLIHHHAQFDGLINSHHYNVHPKMYGCTLSMARLLIGNHLSVSLEAVRKHFGMPGKTTPYDLFNGKHWDEMPPAIQQQIAAGAIDEVESIFAIFQRFMADGFPREEIEVIDQTVKMFVEPVLRADIDLLAKVWESESTKKTERMAALAVTEAALQSSERFAQLLRDEGVEPETKDGKNGPIYAFAKTDQFMRDLQEDDNDRIRTLAEARLGAKSTLMQTRAETLGWMASRGPGGSSSAMPVYLRYCGAHTTRWSGGDGANWQNFKRGSDIRKAIMAPEGYLLAPIDLSQIECRILNFLAGQEDVVEKFRNGEDPYIGIASQAYGFPVTKAHVTERGTGKQLELSCLGANTLVLTDQGVHPITAVQRNMRLWDGVEWVNHCGTVSRGVQSVVDIKGVQLTPDHPILCGSMWRPARHLQNENILFQALESGSANLPFQVTNSALRAAFYSFLSNVHAVLKNIPCIQPIYTRVQLRAAITVLKKRAAIGLKNTMGMQTLCPTMLTAGACSGVSGQFSPVAIPNSPISTQIMLGAVLKYMRPGNAAVKNFFATLFLYPAGTIHCSTWTERIMKKITPLVICDSSHTKKILETAEPSGNLKKLLPTYDIAYAGPRNRFTIISASGPLIVHNCGYQAGAATIKATARLGIYGPPIIIDDQTALRWRDLYRSTHPAVVEYWRMAGRLIARIAGGEPLQWGPMLIKDKKIFGPGGTFLNYTTIEYHQVTKEEYDAGEREGYWRIRTRHGWSKLYSGRLVENVVQWLARIVMSQALIRIARLGYRVVNCTHDELLVLIQKDGNEQRHLKICKAEMVREPTWLSGIPLACEGELSERYAK